MLQSTRCVLAFLAAALVPQMSLAASFAERLSLSVEMATGSMVFDKHPEPTDFGLALQGALRFDLRVVGPAFVSMSFMTSYFPSDAGPSGLDSYCAGLRLEPALGPIKASLNANVGLGRTANLTRATTDLALGFELLSAGPHLAIGPLIRYARVFAAAGEGPGDAQFVTGGISIRLSAPSVQQPGGQRQPTSVSARRQPARLRSPELGRRTPRGSQSLPLGTAADGLRDTGGAPDGVDACVDSATGPDGQPEPSGCPPLVQVGSERIRTSPLSFAPTNELSPASEPILRALVSTLAANPQIARLSIECHSTEQPTNAAARHCEERAAAVMVWLIQHRVASSRLRARGFAEPSATTDAPALRTWIEIRILPPAEGAQP